MSLFAREVEIFLTKTSQGAAWHNWLQIQPKYDAPKDTGVQILSAAVPTKENEFGLMTMAETKTSWELRPSRKQFTVLV
jgi:hypothetical protein